MVTKNKNTKNNTKNTKTTKKVTVEQSVTVEPNGVTTVELPEDTTPVEQTVEPTFTKFNVGGYGVLTVQEPLTLDQFVYLIKNGILPYSNSVTGVPNKTTHNKIPQNLQLHKSTVQNPVKFFWGTIGGLIEQGINTRKGIIEHYVNMGVSYYTVRTQYQIWYVMNKKETQG
jgi:hypothetical protein